MLTILSPSRATHGGLRSVVLMPRLRYLADVGRPAFRRHAVAAGADDTIAQQRVVWVVLLPVVCAYVVCCRGVTTLSPTRGCKRDSTVHIRIRAPVR